MLFGKKSKSRTPVFHSFLHLYVDIMNMLLLVGVFKELCAMPFCGLQQQLSIEKMERKKLNLWMFFLLYICCSYLA